MAQTAASDDRCVALTADGERCSRSAGENDFCYQHDESDPTVSEAETTPEEESTDDQSGVSDADPELDEIEVTADVEDERIEDILSIRKTVKSSASDLVGHPFDGVSEISAAKDGWQAVVEVVERRSVPDTQDVIGRYRIELDEDGTVLGYRRLDRYRRGDTTSFESAQ